MKKSIQLAVLLLILSIASTSCSLFKKTERTVLKTDSTTTQTSKTVDRSTTSTTELIDTTVRRKADSVIAKIDADRFDPAKNPVLPLDTTITDGKVNLNIKFNKKTKTYDFKAKVNADSTHVFLNKTTVKKNDITTDSSKKTVVHKKDTDRVSQPISGKTMLYAGLVLLFLIAIVVVIIRLYNKNKSKLPL